ncbi:hypothetical protein IKF03_02725 [Candidatus Saccharibacteria bacterium]|nr:hypothetical protein [Candidatus Saccharibacteria bacterium]
MGLDMLNVDDVFSSYVDRHGFPNIVTATECSAHCEYHGGHNGYNGEFGKSIIVGSDWKRKGVLRRYLLREGETYAPYNFARRRVVPVSVGDFVVNIRWYPYDDRKDGSTKVFIARICKIGDYNYDTDWCQIKKFYFDHLVRGKNAVKFLTDAGLSEDQVLVIGKAMWTLPYLTRKELEEYERQYFD